jgi:hypothetical protein
MQSDAARDGAPATAHPKATEQHRAKAKGLKKSKPKRAKTARRSAESKTGGVRRPYPRATLEEALRVPVALKEKNGGNPWPPADVAAVVGLSHKNPDFFYLAAASRDFGFTEGSRDSDLISLTEFGRDVVYAPSKAQEDAKLREALVKVEIFRKVLDYYKGANARNAISRQHPIARVQPQSGFSRGIF